MHQKQRSCRNKAAPACCGTTPATLYSLAIIIACTLAKQFGLSERSLRAWESGEKVISKRCWERYFQELLGIP